MMAGGLAILMLSGLSSWGAAPEPCAGPAPTVSRCRENYLPNPTALVGRDPEATRLAGLAETGVKAERAAVEDWFEARKARQLAAKFLKESWFIDPRERDKAEKALNDAIDAYRKAADVLAVKKAATERAAQAATDAVTRVYGLTPPKLDFNDTQASRHPLRSWSPAFSRKEFYDKELGRWRLRTRQEHEVELKRIQGRARETGATMGPLTGEAMTYDGELRIYPEAFGSAEDLAATVYRLP